MKIGGFQEFSLIDYPGRIAAVVFTQGCNFRCPYCHNRELVLPELFAETIPEKEILDFLVRRRGKLEGVVITGGEPTIQKGLTPFIQRVKALGFLVKLDTNGSNPVALERILSRKMVDYVAMDVKASADNYSRLTGVNVRLEDITRSIELIKGSGIDYEFRTTLVKPLHPDPEEEIAAIRAMIGDCRRYRLQRFVAADKVLDPALLEGETISEDGLDRMKQSFEVAA